jgi:hypothetical protein
MLSEEEVAAPEEMTYNMELLREVVRLGPGNSASS